MKDIHTHILFGIDDGCSDLEESIKMIKTAQNQGITDMILTPHYIENSIYDYNNKKKKEIFDRLVEEVKKEKNEVYITENCMELLKKQEITTLNNTKYILIEFPLGNMFYNTKEIIFQLVRAGYIPIIAHPERYRIFKRHPEHIKDYLGMGALLQGNYQSLYGKYGKEAKKTLIYYLKKGWITFLASDCHHEINFDTKKLRKKLKSLVKSDSMIEDLLQNNFDKIMREEDFSITR